VFCLTPVETRVSVIVITLALISRFSALLLGFSIDDYRKMSQVLPEFLDAKAIGIGRALGYFVFAAMARIGAAPPRAGVLGVLLLTLALTAVGLAACRLWGISGRFGASLIVVCMVVLHPYQTEMFTFRTAAPVVAVALTFVFIGLLICDRSRIHWLAAVGLVACGLSTYQLPLNHLALVVLFSVALPYAAGELPAGWRRTLATRLGLLAAGAVVYGASAIAVARSLGIGAEARTTLLGLNEAGSRAAAALESAVRILAVGEPVLPAVAKAAIAATFGFGFIALAARSLRSPIWSVRARPLAVMAAFAAGVLLWFGVLLALREWWIVPRTVSHVSLFWAGMMATVYVAGGRRTRHVMATGLAFVFFSFIGINQQILADQLRVNARDSAQANRIVARLEQLPNFTSRMNVTVLGGSWGYASPIRTVQGDMNISVLYPAWSKLDLLNEVSGYAFTDAPPEARAKADEYCKTAPKWPAVGSVSAAGSTAVVCLPSTP
jgi:hypothetical protein